MCTLYIVQCTMYIVQGQCTVHCTVYNIHCTLYSVQCTLYIIHANIKSKITLISNLWVECVENKNIYIKVISEVLYLIHVYIS